MVPTGVLFFQSGGCNLISKVVPSGNNPVNGNMTGCVKIETGVFTTVSGQPYIARHFDVTPTAGSTATITLYVKQSEFNDYNTFLLNNPSIAFTQLPSGPSGNTNVIRVYQYHGNWGGNNIFDYPGAIDIITPVVTWNAANSWWELNFNVSAFSGFFVGSTPTANLPLLLISFSGYRESNYNVLKWTTANENNNRGFYVERSLDGIHFTSIGFVNSLAPNGTSTASLHYTFIDNNIQGEKQYYRLRQVDFDGKQKLSYVILIKGTRPTVFTMNIFPNPAHQLVNVQLESPVQEEVTLLVFDVTGKMVRKKTATIDIGFNVVPIEISNLASGTYTIMLPAKGDRKPLSIQFIKY
jgi:hypothetical protein